VYQYEKVNKYMAGGPYADAHALPEGVSDRAYVRYPDLEGRSVFITGGGSGIGAYLVDAFASQGANVGFVSLTAATGTQLCDAVGQRYGRRPFFRDVDVRDIAALKAAMRDFAAVSGPISVLVNNAARDTRHALGDLSVDAWDESLATNLRPYFFAAQQIAEETGADGGAIINVGSNSANLGLTGYPAYVTAKAAISGLTRALARELGPRGIRVNSLVPGWVMTERQRALWVTPEALQQCLDEQALKVTISGEDVAEAALFLASRASSMITGQSIIIDAGRVMS
jgi:NAD(P)-dependent dehydrogenase (short-subunit alcohol dehydrogenase family)